MRLDAPAPGRTYDLDDATDRLLLVARLGEGLDLRPVRHDDAMTGRTARLGPDGRALYCSPIAFINLILDLGR